MTLCLRTPCGAALPLDSDRWHAEPTAEDDALLDRLRGPVLDVGCGPGRHVVALNHRGVVALGIDASPSAVALARARGASVLERSIFDRVPGAGRWNSALLLDGNVGIGGDAVALLRRVAVLLAEAGMIAVEVEPPGVDTVALVVCVEDGAATSRWFPWARLGVDGLTQVANDAGLRVVEVWEGGGRWFALLAR